MSSLITERVRNAVLQDHWNEAVALLQTCDASQAAEALGSFPFEQQQRLFRRLPLGLAASVVTQFPYYDQYVLLHARPAGEMRALVDKINPDDRMRFFDELPEEAWQRLMDELSSAPVESLGVQEPGAYTRRNSSSHNWENRSSRHVRLRSSLNNRMEGKFRSSPPWTSL